MLSIPKKYYKLYLYNVNDSEPEGEYTPYCPVSGLQNCVSCSLVTPTKHGSQ